MDQLLVDSAIRRLKVRNAKKANLTKRYFSDLSHLIASCINSAGAYSPGKSEPMTLRASYMPLYRWMAIQLTDLYGFPVEAELLSGVITSQDLTNGVIDVKVELTHNRKIYNFAITFNDEGAPYSTEFSALLTKAGGNGERFSQLIGLV